MHFVSGRDSLSTIRLEASDKPLIAFNQPSVICKNYNKECARTGERELKFDTSASYKMQINRELRVNS